MVFDHILWMLVCLRLLGTEPVVPAPDDTLIHYAAELEIQYCRLRIAKSASTCREARELTHHLVRMLGLPQAAEPFPLTLLPLLLQSRENLPKS